MKQSDLLYQGKTKSLYATDEPDYLIVTFRDDVTAFNRKKHEIMDGKGTFNNQFNAFIMQKLKEAGVDNHFHKTLSENQSVVKHLKMLPIESVVRNRSAGSFCKRFGIERGRVLEPATFEFFLKDDERDDPMVNDSILLTLHLATKGQLDAMREISHQVNETLTLLFKEAGFILVDYKLEFGLFHGAVLLGDEFTLDGCRIWDLETREVFDKDRFREGLEGDLLDFYRQVAKKLGL